MEDEELNMADDKIFGVTETPDDPNAYILPWVRAGETAQEFARRDDCLERMVPSDLRFILGRLESARDSAHARIAELESDLADYERTFKLRWSADQRAIKRWQEVNPGNDLVWPDHSDLVIWLGEEARSNAARIAELESALGVGKK